MKLQSNLAVISQLFSETAEDSLNEQIAEEISLIVEIFLRADKESFDNIKLESILKKTDLNQSQKTLFIDTWGSNKESVSIAQMSLVYIILMTWLIECVLLLFVVDRFDEVSLLDINGHTLWEDQTAYNGESTAA